MTKYFATCAKGLEPILARELSALKVRKIEPGRGGVSFEGDIETIYLTSLHLRTAVRILRPIAEFDVTDSDQLYEAVRQVNWADFMGVDHTLAVDCNVRDSAITHSQYAARRVKDAICDQFRERTGARPSVDVEQPAIGLNLHIYRDHAILSLDGSWSSLHKRGYRPIQTRAPLNEALAAGLLMHLGYDGSCPLVDWMCGSGTFLIEGLWIAQHRPPGLTRKWFAFQGWKEFERGRWAAIREEARKAIIAQPPYIPYGSDIRGDAVEFGKSNAKAAGVGHLLEFVKQSLNVAKPRPTDPPGILICNPPYGERLGEEEELMPLYREMGIAFAKNWPGWKLALLTSNTMLARQVKLPVVRSTPFFNGSLDCKLWEFASSTSG